MTTSRRLIALLALVSILASVLAADTETPTEDAERPSAKATRFGIRMTPDIARGFSRTAIHQNMTGKLGLSDDQVDALTEDSARHLMEMCHSEGEAVQGFMEFIVPTLVESGGLLDKEAAEGFAKRTLPIMPAYRRMLDGFEKDARKILNPEQMDGFDRILDDYRAEVDAFEKRMNRWKAGDAQEKENPFGPSPVPEERAGRFKDQPPEEKNLQRAREHARWQLRRIGPSEWKRFLDHTTRLFEFTEKQLVTARGLLDVCNQRCDAVMTDQWRRDYQRNRMLNRLRWTLRDLSQGPWAYHIDREYRDLMAPIEALGIEFRNDVLTLVEDEQKQKVIEMLKAKADLHGMDAETFAVMEGLIGDLGSPTTGDATNAEQGDSP